MIHDIWRKLCDSDMLRRDFSAALPGLLARYTRAYGELLLHFGARDEAWNLLTAASMYFADNHDWAGQAECWALLGAAQRRFGYPAGAHSARVLRVLDNAMPTLPRPRPMTEDEVEVNLPEPSGRPKRGRAKA